MKKIIQKKEKNATFFSWDNSDAFRLFFDNSSVGKSITGMDGSLHVNKSFCDLLGYTEVEMQRLNWKEITHPDDIEASNQMIKGLIDGSARSARIEKRYLHKSGEIIWATVNTFLQREPDGTPLYFMTNVLDITQLKKTEEALRQSNERLHLANLATFNIIWDWNLQTNSLWLNDHFKTQLGYADEEIEPGIESWTSRIHPDDLYRVETGIQQTIDSGLSFWNDQYRLRRKDGQYEDVEDRGYIVRDKSNNPTRMIGAMRIVTGVKLVEESLQRNTERLRNLHRIDIAILQAIESPEEIAKTALLHIRELLRCQRASVGIFDLEKKNVQIFAANVDGKTIVQLGEILTDEAYGDIQILKQGKMEVIEDLTKVMSPSVITRILQSEGIQASINVPLVSAQKLYGVLNIGWEYPRSISLEELEIAGEVAGEITIVIEQAHLLSETKRYATDLEEKVKDRTAQLLASNKELETFSYSVSHDLRAPLRHISGYVELLMSRFKEDLPEKAQHYLTTISEAVGEMGTLIDDLLKFSRTGQMELNLRLMDMQKAFSEAQFQVSQANPDRDIIWKISPLPMVTGDYQLLLMVWVNLISNAVKFTRTRKPAEIEVGVKEEKTELIFFIRDNGVGFDMQYADKLFGVFQRLHPTVEFEGTGIGLANVRRTISRHGGKTWAEAEPDKGAAFFFSLPKR